jgi:hypothetical protein
VRAGASPSQKGTVGGHAHDTRLDAADPPRRAPEEEHVALHALDGPVLVDGADRRVVRVGDDAIVGRLGNGAARRQRGEPGAPPASQDVVDAVAVKIRGPASTPGLDAV